jgi:hypothetical protein
MFFSIRTKYAGLVTTTSMNKAFCFRILLKRVPDEIGMCVDNISSIKLIVNYSVLLYIQAS